MIEVLSRLLDNNNENTLGRISDLFLKSNYYVLNIIPETKLRKNPY